MDDNIFDPETLGVLGDNDCSSRFRQFNIAAHYDVMEQLDAEVHDDTVLATAEAVAALGIVTRRLGRVPRSVFLPCFGTGRHIRALLEAGVEHIVGVDLSPACVAKARRQFVGDPRVQLHVGDLTDKALTASLSKCDAAILLGNSFGDVIDPDLAAKVTAGMMTPLVSGGVLVFDYIGEGYLDRCRKGHTSTWGGVINGVAVHDARTPRYDMSARVMTIDVVATRTDNGDIAWVGFYQKLIIDDSELIAHFGDLGVALELVGQAPQVVVDYYNDRDPADLGMIGRSTWWLATK